MKKLFYFFSAIICLYLASCDYISVPKPNAIISDTGTTVKIHVRKILLEDYTGHKCSPCPGASEFAQDSLKHEYGDKLIIISIHASNFALPYPGTNYAADYRTTAGNAFFSSTQFGISNTPSGDNTCPLNYSL